MVIAMRRARVLAGVTFSAQYMETVAKTRARLAMQLRLVALPILQVVAKQDVSKA